MDKVKEVALVNAEILILIENLKLRIATAMSISLIVVINLLNRFVMAKSFYWGPPMGWF